MSKSNTSLAILNLAAGENLAVLSVDLSVDESGWQQLLPAGHFRAVDGRPFDVPGNHWFIDAEVAANLIALANERVNDLVIDYEHQTLKAGDNGEPAPASGWFKEMEWREGSGLWIKPKWTPRAASFIKNGEYKYLSAVFPYDAATGKPLRLHSAALVNRPGIDGMQAVEALAALSLKSQSPLTNPTEHSMNELLKKMLAQLGISVEDGKEPDATAALAALSALQAKAGSADTLATEVAALKANDGGNGTPDPAKYAPVEVVHQLHAQIAVLSAQGAKGQLDQLIDDAKRTGKLLPAMEEWARNLGQKDMAALSAYLDKAQPIAALGGMQTKDKAPEPHGNDPVAALSAEQKQAADLLGMSHAAYAKTIANQEDAQ